MQGYRRKFYSADIFDEITYLVTNTLFLFCCQHGTQRCSVYHKDDHQYEEQYEEILSTDVVDAGVMYNHLHPAIYDTVQRHTAERNDEENSFVVM